MNEFTPKRFGNKDFELEQKIINCYADLCDQANELLCGLDCYLGYSVEEYPEAALFFQFMNSKDPRSLLYLKYIEKRDISFPGINISKVIELGLVDVPLSAFSNLLDSRIKLLKSIQNTEELKFHFPLIHLWDPELNYFCLLDVDDKQNSIFQSPDFEIRLNLHTGNFTASESDNLILEAIEKTIDSFNNLMHLGIIKNGKGRWMNGIEKLSGAILFNGNEENPLSVNPRINRLYDFKRFFSETVFSPTIVSQQDVLKFVAPTLEQLEDKFENQLLSEQTMVTVALQKEETIEEIIQTE